MVEPHAVTPFTEHVHFIANDLTIIAERAYLEYCEKDHTNINTNKKVCTWLEGNLLFL